MLKVRVFKKLGILFTTDQKVENGFDCWTGEKVRKGCEYKWPK